MKWIILDGKKDPQFNILYAVWVKTEQESDWIKAKLYKVEQTEKGKEFVFINEKETVTWNNATHYAVVEQPKQKE